MGGRWWDQTILGQSRYRDRQSDLGRHMVGHSCGRDRQPRVWSVVTTGRIGVLWILAVARRQARNQRYQGERYMGFRQAPLARNRLGRVVVDQCPRCNMVDPLTSVLANRAEGQARGADL